MAKQAHILVIDGDKSIAQAAATTLHGSSNKVTSTAGDKALETVRDVRPDLILLDLTPPKGNGAQILQQLRAEGEYQTGAPVIVLVARDLEEEALAAIETGADDFLVKPFRPGELAARAQLALRRGAREEGSRAVALRAGPIFVNADRREVFIRSATGEMRQVGLTKREFALLRALMAHKNQMMTRAQLVREGFGEHAQVEPGNLGAYIHRLREKVEPNPGIPRYIVTDRGQGFKIID